MLHARPLGRNMRTRRQHEIATRGHTRICKDVRTCEKEQGREDTKYTTGATTGDNRRGCEDARQGCSLLAKVLDHLYWITYRIVPGLIFWVTWGLCRWRRQPSAIGAPG
jgi:hypothetical protein